MDINNKEIIVLDGADGVGKSTQLALLKETYPNLKFNKFPVYDSETGFFITQYLKGNMNSFLDPLPIMDQVKYISTLYTMDRVNWFRTHYDRLTPLICDRYTTSNIIHMSAKLWMNGVDIDEILDYIDWLNHFEHDIHNIPFPSIVIYLDAPVEFLIKNLEKTGKELDIHENIKMLEAIDEIKSTIFKYCNFTVVNCVDALGLRSVVDIHNDINDIITKYYNNKYKFTQEQHDQSRNGYVKFISD